MKYHTDLILGEAFCIFIYYWMVCNSIFDRVTVKTPNSAKRIDGEQNCLLIVWYERRRKKIKFVISVWTWKTLMCAWLIDKVASHIFDTIPCMTTHEKHSIGYNGHNFENLVSDQKCKQPF